MKLKNNYFIDGVKSQFSTYGSSLYSKNGDFIIKEINDQRSDKVVEVSLSSMESGKLYFLMYDLSGKSSNMEKFSPILMLDILTKDNRKKLFGLSLNFIPVATRTLLFNTIANYNLDVLSKNKDVKIDKEYPMNKINFPNIYNMLKDIGFEWAIREFELTYINKIYNISTNIMVEFVSMSTAKITKVDDGKLIEIWQKKLLTQGEREKKLIQGLLGDYNKMAQEFDNKFSSLEERNANLQSSINTINRIF